MHRLMTVRSGNSLIHDNRITIHLQLVNEVKFSYYIRAAVIRQHLPILIAYLFYQLILSVYQFLYLILKIIYLFQSAHVYTFPSTPVCFSTVFVKFTCQFINSAAEQRMPLVARYRRQGLQHKCPFVHLCMRYVQIFAVIH